MADPISAEPRNWDDDILLKVSMPGKSLRETTKIKMRQAEERSVARQNSQQNMQNQVPIIGSQRNIQNIPQTSNPQTVPSLQPVNPAVPLQSEPIKENTSNTENLQSNDLQPQAQEHQETIQSENVELQETIRSEEVQSDLANLENSETEIETPQFQQEEIAQTEFKDESSEDDQIFNNQEPQVNEQPEQVVETSSRTYIDNTNKYKIMTIEPEREDTIKNVPPHLSSAIDVRKVESFANNIIASDAFRKKLNKHV